jgi:DTW domain-containing protein YfiP
MVAHRTRVLILQHPEEHRHPLNTGRLAVLGLQRAELLVGEHFPQLASILAASSSAFLLFPGDSAQTPQPLDCYPPGESVLLIVPDGTWRKARKILYANPLLSTLPRLSLPAGDPSRYRVRKTREPAAVSTIEAIARTLAALEPAQDFSPILRPFDALIDQQIAAMGGEVYQRNHVEPDTRADIPTENPPNALAKSPRA